MKLSLFIGCLTIAFVWGQQLPPDIDKCQAGDAICIAKTITYILQSYPKGIPSIGLDAVDAISFQNVIVSRMESSKLDLKFHTLTVRGFENTTVLDAKGFDADIPRVFELSAFTPLLRLEGEYETQGILLTMPIQGRGQALVELKDCQFRCKVRAVEDQRLDGKRYLEIPKVKCLVDVQSMHINFDNLFNNKDLSDTMNDLANNNWFEIWKTLRKGINSALDQVSGTILRRVAKKFSYDDFFQE
ncbi:circadian clock-controlled protein isoform X1 [Drosophila pseudoobscura]|uniref:Circadian clock-controlled protein isoform X1 n=1 Tax=Drosophila pseudoobscura pseudoobscura TaxID=46245 RepID=A0A6I8V3N3_DROPS|nr:circadian clock-controlled protein isoform X1 [Drosophila pseudoobscura]